MWGLWAELGSLVWRSGGEQMTERGSQGTRRALYGEPIVEKYWEKEGRRQAGAREGRKGRGY